VLSVLGFLAVLGPLVVFHEFGHYLFARLFNVKAEIFSVGFGKKLWSRQIGETEWRLSLIPLGGYVKLLGEETDAPLPPELAARSLHRQAAWKRFFIFFGGPLFNFILAAFVYMLIVMIGEPQTASVVGRVVQGSDAAIAGFHPGDRIVDIQGRIVSRWEEVVQAFNDRPSQPTQVQVLRGATSAPVTLTVKPRETVGYTSYGENALVGEVQGLIGLPRSAVLGVSDPQSWAGKAGLKTGDALVSWAGAPVSSFEQVEALFAQAPVGTPQAVRIRTGGKGPEKDLQLVKTATETTLSSLGIHSSELFVEKVMDKSPAQKAGLKAGDRLVAVGKVDVFSFFTLRESVQKGGESSERKVQVAWEREGKRFEAEIVPDANESRDPTLKKITQYTIGVVPMLTWGEPVTFIERTLNPALALWKGTERMVVNSAKNFISIGKMFSGNVSLGTLGGPVLIGKLAGESLSRGLLSYLNLMAILSIGLGVLNILPVPVLDGGHLVLLGIESIRGKPLSMKQMEIAQNVGLAMILLLMLVVLKNDVTRLVN
jgi:regulator of sigma E protease